ncbi:GGDEF domain-containing protein [Rhodopseudomonas palustris]|uniref:GGDEF domain-containing protein n=1 Tax=Rhodopseudomonas palustris TaxID=1076 RepID=UPI002ACDC4B4|nr:GGDEF domain-containing protein [Rhodopseudomonas palustris]WQG99756.1 GGDEF domain-containing protein [Rhodopseudomonas palustris]
MLSVPTLWVVFLINFLALGLVWTHVMRSYPNFTPARYWTAACFVVSLGAGFGMLRGVIDTKVPLIAGGGTVVLAAYLISMGVFRFYDRQMSWRLALGATAACTAGLAFFLLVIDSMMMRILIYSVAQAIPIAMTLPLMLSRSGRRNPGARMAATVAIMMLLVYAVRSGAATIGIGGELSVVNFNDFQASLVLMLVFLSMTLNFSFLLMAIDRLRSEVESLALIDDLTGISNRRHLLQRMAAQCQAAMQTDEPFTVLAIDLDGFKAINDGHGHAAGDECLRRFSRAAQARLRPGDLFARTGGDEFCVVMPATTLREGAMVARHILEESRTLSTQGGDETITIAASIGVAQWTPQIGMHPDRLIAAADAALYNAKKLGKDRYAVHEPTVEPLPTFLEPVRKIA